MSGFLHHKYLPFAALILLGLATRFLFIWYPAEVVFDEVHFGKFVSAYYTGKYYFDIHPPLGKLLIAGFVKFFGFRAGFDFDRIGEGYGEIPYVALRFLPNLAGAFIPVAVFGWLSALGLSRPAAFLAGALILLDNAYLAQSRFILVDSFLLVFGFAGLWLFFRSRNKNYDLWGLAAAGFMLALSVSIKWTGLGFFGLALAVMVWGMIRRAPASTSRNQMSARSSGAPHPIDLGSLVRPWRTPSSLALRNFLEMLAGARPAALLISIAAAVYLAVFWVHFSFLPKSGPGDPFMSPAFLKTLKGSAYESAESVQPLGLAEKFIELNRVMYSSNMGLAAGHPYASKWYTWPIMQRPVFYWVKDFGEKSGLPAQAGRIYLLGNPVVWWLSTIGVAVALFLWRDRRAASYKWWLYVGYIGNLLPFIGISRVVFLYHYFPSLGFAVAILAGWLFGEGIGSPKRRRLWFLILGFAVLGFLFFAPLSYGMPLSEFWYKMRVWMPSWI